MLFRSNNRNFVEIIRLNFSSDEEYYTFVAKTKGIPFEVKPNDPEECILNVIQNNIVNIRKHTNPPRRNDNK